MARSPLPSSASLPFSMRRHILFSHQPFSPYDSSQQRNDDPHAPALAATSRDLQYYQRRRHHPHHHQHHHHHPYHRAHSPTPSSAPARRRHSLSSSLSSSSLACDAHRPLFITPSSSSASTMTQYNDPPLRSRKKQLCQICYAPAARADSDEVHTLDGDDDDAEPEPETDPEADDMITPIEESELRACSKCNAHVCAPCLREWVSVKIQSGLVQKLTCVSCPAPLSDAEILAVCGADTLRRCTYLRQRHALRHDASAAWCPVDNCWALLPKPQRATPTSTPSPVVHCLDCDAPVCTACGVLAPNSAQHRCALPAVSVRARVWQATHTKRCPVCNVHIERAGGCLQMTCTKCQTKFCWKCRGVLVLHGHPEHVDGEDETHGRDGEHHRQNVSIIRYSNQNNFVFTHRSRRVLYHHYRRQQQLHSFHQRRHLHNHRHEGDTHAHIDLDPDLELDLAPELDLDLDHDHHQQHQQHQRRAGAQLYARLWRSRRQRGTGPRTVHYRGCICSQMHKTSMFIKLTATVIVLGPFALVATVVATPPVVIVYATLPRERKQDVRRRVITFLRRL